MREIKFRAWDKKDKRWWTAGKDGDWFYRDGNEIKAIKDVELMQFTGRLDKNGKEIYENDLVKGKFNHSHLGFIDVEGQLIMDEFMWCIETKDGDIYSLNRLSYLEIIGNIYSNPELLTK